MAKYTMHAGTQLGTRPGTQVHGQEHRYMARYTGTRPGTQVHMAHEKYRVTGGGKRKP